MVYGVWCMLYGVWCVVYGVWVYSVYCMGVCCTVVSPAELTNQTAPNKLHQTNCTTYRLQPNQRIHGFTNQRLFHKINGSSSKSTALPPNQRLYSNEGCGGISIKISLHSVVTVLSQCCHSVVTVLSQCCHSVVTVLSQCCHSVVTVSPP
jgi:hypothetical protein